MPQLLVMAGSNHIPISKESADERQLQQSCAAMVEQGNIEHQCLHSPAIPRSRRTSHTCACLTSICSPIFVKLAEYIP
jgi:hypothetical protein